MIPALEKRPFKKLLVGERIKLLNSPPELAEPLWKSIVQDRKLRGASWAWLESLDQLRAYLEKHNSDLPNGEVVYLIAKDQSIIGTFHIHSFCYADHKTEVGYAIEKAYEGYGYVAESLKLVESELKRLQFNKIIINCDVKNLRSVSVAEKNGYLREGLLVQDCIEDGQFRDSALFGKIL